MMVDHDKDTPGLGDAQKYLPHKQEVGVHYESLFPSHYNRFSSLLTFPVPK